MAAKSGQPDASERKTNSTSRQLLHVNDEAALRARRHAFDFML